jgi:hypothetical protein
MNRAISLVILFVCAAGIVALVAQAQAPKKHPSPASLGELRAAVQAEDYLEIGSARVTLGMTKAQVAEALKGYSLRQNDDEWLAMDLAQPMTLGDVLQPQPGLSGMTFQFTAGRLSAATREWPIRNGDVAGTIFAVFSHWQRERAGQGRFLANCGVVTDVAASPSATFQRTSIVCGEKAVVIMKDSSGTQPQGVAEVLGERRP